MSVLEFFDVFRMFLGELENRGYDQDTRQATLEQVITSLKDVLFTVEDRQQQQQQYAPQYQQQYAPPPQQYQQQYAPPQQQYAPPPQQYQQPPPQQQWQQPQQGYQRPTSPPPRGYQPPTSPPPRQLVASPSSGYQQPPPQQYQPPPMQQAPPQQQYQQPPPQQQQYQQPPQQQQGPPDDEPQGGPMLSGGDEQIRQGISTIVYGTGLRLNQVFKTMNVGGDRDGIDMNQFVEGMHKLGVKVSANDMARIAEPYMAKNKLSYSGFIRLLAGGNG